MSRKPFYAFDSNHIWRRRKKHLYKLNIVQALKLIYAFKFSVSSLLFDSISFLCFVLCFFCEFSAHDFFQFSWLISKSHLGFQNFTSSMPPLSWTIKHFKPFPFSFLTIKLNGIKVTYIKDLLILHKIQQILKLFFFFLYLRMF